MNLLNIPFAAALLAITSILCFAQPNTNLTVLPWGQPNRGLRMSLSLHKPDGSTPEFCIAFENVGERDTVLYLGHMYSNGAILLLVAIRLVVTDAYNRSMELQFFDRRYPAMKGGRIDPYLTPLRVGSIYTLKLDLGNFLRWGYKRDSELLPGRYRISARFEGRGFGEQATPDSTWVGMVRVWKGQLQTNEVEFVKQ